MVVAAFLASRIHACVVVHTFLDERVIFGQQRGFLQLGEEEKEEQTQESDHHAQLGEARRPQTKSMPTDGTV